MPGLEPGIPVCRARGQMVACPRAGRRPDPWDGRVRPGHDGDV